MSLDVDEYEQALDGMDQRISSAEEAARALLQLLQRQAPAERLVYPTSLLFEAVEGGPDPPMQYLPLKDFSIGAFGLGERGLSMDIVANENAMRSGIPADALTAHVAGLKPGTYVTSLNFVSNSARGPRGTETVEVKLVVSPKSK